MNKSYGPHDDIKLKELTMHYQNEGVKGGDRETSKQVILFNKRDGIHRIVVKGVCKT